MPALDDEAIWLAHRYGADEEFVRAGGGNVSAKADGILRIKPSGVAMTDLHAEDLIPLDIATLMAALHSPDPGLKDPVQAAAQAAQLGGDRRPSVEILFHALIDDALVLHLHPLIANAVTCNEYGRQLTEELLGDAALWVDYLNPGIPLARGIEAARQEFVARTGRPAPAITLLGNHGIIVSGPDATTITERITWLTTTIGEAIGSSQPSQADRLDVSQLEKHFRQATGRAAVAHAVDGVACHASRLDSGPVTRGPLIPDQIVYSGSMPVLLELDDDAAAVCAKVQDFCATYGRPPITAVIPGQAVLAVGDRPRAAEIARDTYLDALRVARDADLIGKVRVMTNAQREFIETWEAESYRQSVAAQTLSA